MFKKYLLGFATFALAFGIFSVSVLHSASVSYVFATKTPPPSSLNVLGVKTSQIDYQLPFPGTILPDSPLWNLKALRDKIWYTLTFDHLKKAEMALLFSDKRLQAAQTLFDAKKPDIALSTLSKGEKYLEMATDEATKAKASGENTSTFLTKLATASLKHRQIIEENLLPLAPEGAKPEIVKTEDYSKNTYKYSRDGLNSLGITPPKSPFDGQ